MDIQASSQAMYLQVPQFPVSGTTDPVQSILTGIEVQCNLRPDSVAIIDDSQQWSYAELWNRSRQVALWCEAAGQNEGCHVGICMDRSADAIAAMMGVMLAGAAFVPLDPEYPVARMQQMAEDAQLQWVLSEAKYESLFKPTAAHSPKCILLHDAISGFDPDRCGRKPSDLAEQQLAYIMYTSGSTGKPKGVQIEHGALATYCAADIEIYELTPDDRTLQFSTLCFDIAIEEIFPPLLSGGTVVVRPRGREDSEIELSSIVDRYQVTALHLATAYWHEWVDLMEVSGERVPRSLRMVLATGEKVLPTRYQQWLSLCDHEVLWCNAYGPTETTVTATVFIPPTGWNGESMPIGRPLQGYEAWILDDQDQPLSIGETGDLYISGKALARGYLNQPEKTESVFRGIDVPGRGVVRMYRTGDLARWLPDGNIEFAGRVDHQLKVGSYRIEPGEIEYQIASHPSVGEALVVCPEIKGRRILVAYVTTEREGDLVAEIDQYLRDRLPEYMIPSRYGICRAFPKTINGKIDRAQLPAPETCMHPIRVEQVLPRTLAEQRLAEVWKEVLGVESLGIDDNFFDLGGSSLLVTRVIARLRKHYDFAIPVRDFFANPTIASIARQLSLIAGESDSGGSDGLSVSSMQGITRIRQGLPCIDPFYFDEADKRLFAIRYPAMEIRANRRKYGIVICQPEGHEYARAHRNLQQLAVQLSQNGFDVLRFDYSGIGNSSGVPGESVLSDWVSQVGRACEVLCERSGVDSVGLLGVRLGGALAAMSKSPRVSKRVLWDPVIDGGRYIRDLKKLHQHSLADGWRYLYHRKARPGQLFGSPMSNASIQSRELLNITTDDIPEHTTILISRNYADHEVGLEGWNVEETGDEIFWDLPQYTSAAFSSPRTAKAVIQAFIG